MHVPWWIANIIPTRHWCIDADAQIWRTAISTLLRNITHRWTAFIVCYLFIKAHGLHLIYLKFRQCSLCYIFVSWVIMLPVNIRICFYFLVGYNFVCDFFFLSGRYLCWTVETLESIRAFRHPLAQVTLLKLYLEQMIKQMLSPNVKELYWKQNIHSQLNSSCSQLWPFGITTALCIGAIETKDLS